MSIPISQRRALLLSAILLVPLSGCAGQLKTAMLDHAKSTRAVADTITKSLSVVNCDGVKDAATCQAALTAIADQAKVLEQGAAKLEGQAK